jgi:sn-glycerol 3-phosphate transport system ATP-binding protein
MAKITLRDVRKSYGKTEVVHGVNLDIAHGELVVILGPSGCGKSTLLRMVAGLETITSGEISIGDTVVNKLEPRQRGCAMVFQNYALYPHMTVAKNIGYSLKIAGLSRPERTARVEQVAATLGLTEFLDRKPGQLSGGQRQRVAMGRAMIREPEVFLYDEPLSNLDAKLRVAMRVEIRKLHQRLETTTLFVTHDQVEAMTLADRIVVMNKGIIEQAGTPADVYGWPETTYVANFLGSPGLNLLNGIAHPDKGVIAFADGQYLAYDRRRWPEIVHGPLIAGFRAEAVRFGARSLTARFDFAEELGSAKLLHSSFVGQTLVAHASTQAQLCASDPFPFSVDPADVQLFDADTGHRLKEHRRNSDRQRAPLERIPA